MALQHDHYTVSFGDKPVASFPARFGREAFAWARMQANTEVFCVVRVTRSTVPTKMAEFPARVSMYRAGYARPTIYAVTPATTR